MKIILECPAGPSAESATYVIEFDPDGTNRAVLAALDLDFESTWFVGQRPIHLEEPMAAGPLLSGSLISSERRPSTLWDRLESSYECELLEPDQLPRVLVLRPGKLLLGRHEDSDIPVSDPTVSAHHLMLVVSAGGVSVIEQGSTNGTWIDDQELQPGVEYSITDEPFMDKALEIGDTRLVVRRSEGPDLTADGRGLVVFNRPARIREPIDTFTVRLPDEFNEREAQIDMLAGAAGGATGIAYGSYIPLIGTGVNLALQKRRQRRSRKEVAKKKSAYQQRLTDIDEEIAVEVAAQVERRNRDNPSPQELARIAQAPTLRLWERRAGDDDAFEISVGVGTMPAEIVFEIRGDRQDVPAPFLDGVPCTVDLAEVGAIGIAGGDDVVTGVARWILGQMLALRAPEDIRLALITDTARLERWSFAAICQHIQPDPGLALVGHDEETVLATLAYLASILDARVEQQGVGAPRTRWRPQYVLVLDGARRFREYVELSRLMRDGPSVGISTIALDATEARLPEEITSSFDVTRADSGTLRIDGTRTRTRIAPTCVDAAWLREVARATTPIRLARTDGSSAIPTSITLNEVIDTDLNDPIAVAATWSRNAINPIAPIGLTSTDRLVLDLRRDGPHALVAGTTGAGKSAFLQALIASLAVSCSPEAVNFVLIDFKGGSAFAGLANLPHTVGFVTNLDAHLTERALTSLNAELRRREELLRSMSASDIDDAWRRDPVASRTASLARLVIVIDELAELVKELPEFVSGLIRIARVGRSLGVHLVLATQRPGSVVTPEMLANTGLRVALRVEGRAESSDLIESPNAALISRLMPGRGFVKSSVTGQLLEFQTVNVAAPSSDDAQPIEARAVRIDGSRLGRRPVFDATVGEHEYRSELDDLCERLNAAAGQSGFVVPRRPWLDPLPNVVDSSQISRDATGRASRIPVGLLDLPDRQTQEPLALDLDEPDSWAVVGAARSGRSSFLQACALQIAKSMPVSATHLYGLDLGGGALLALEDLPHCGAVVRPVDNERFEALIRRLLDEHRRRQSLLVSSGVSDLSVLRRASREAPPYIVVLVDRWELLSTEFPLESGSSVISDLARLMREGAPTGFRFLITGDRGLLTDRIFSHVAVRLALRLNDPNDYRVMDIRPQQLPEQMLPGRAVRAGDGAEVQLLRVVDGGTESIRSAVQELSVTLGERPKSQIRVDTLPDRITKDLADHLPRSPLSDETAVRPSLVGGDELSRIELSVLDRRVGMIIAGPSRSGRSTLAASLVEEALDRGARVMLSAVDSKPRFQPLVDRGLEILTDEQLGDPDGLSLEAERAIVIVLDDADRTLRGPLSAALPELLSRHSTLRVLVVGATDELMNDVRGLVAIVKREQAGVLLMPQMPLEGQLFGQRVDRAFLGGGQGRGLLYLGGQVLRVQAIT